MEEKSKVMKLLPNNIVIWHCVNHWLELLIWNTTKEDAGINQFKSLINMLYVLNQALPKMQKSW